MKPDADNPMLRCSTCACRWPFDPTRWRCDCGAVLEIVGGPSFDPGRVDEDNYSLWRYRESLPLSAGAAPVTMDEGWTPLVSAEWEGRSVRLKLEPLNPTGSFKDRGATVLVTALRSAGVQRVVEDSSGNAGAALSAYAGRAGMQATVYVPAHASPVKQAQIAAYGAKVVAVPGPRIEAARAAQGGRAAESGDVYASHVYSSLYPQGMKTMAFELWEQLGKRAPTSVVVPLGHGSLLLGLSLGFGALLSAGLIDHRPRLFGVQAEACAPLALAWERGADDVEPVDEGDTVAEGVRIAAPPWGRMILSAVRESDGAILALPDTETLAAQEKLAHQGIYVEPTSALAAAALDQLGDRLGEVPVVVLTGSGFKSPPSMHDGRNAAPAANWQRHVADFIHRRDLQHEPSAHALDLASEVGELAKEVLLATNYGQRPLQHRPELADEIGDALYSLLALAEACGVDAGSALDAALGKYRRRLSAQGEAGSVSEDPVSGEFEVLQRALGHHFSDEGFLRRALTHPSYVNEHPEEDLGDNQRLEFLGDAVLDFIAAAWVYRRYTGFDEGRMTRLRAALVCTEALARLARQVGIDEVLRLGCGEEEGGGRERSANLCDAFEAVVGALYLDGGMAAASSFVEPLLEPVAEETLATAADQDAKSRLQEWSQADLSVTPRYRIVAEKGPDHAKTFVAEVLLGQDMVGQGEGHSKQAAEQAAARAALRAFRKSGAATSSGSPLTDS